MKSFAKDMRQNAIVDISESWLTADDKTSSWNEALITHELFRCDGIAIHSKKGSCNAICTLETSLKNTRFQIC